MSKYHPLDVRHPDNRARERKSFLLDPPTDSTYALKPLRELAAAPARRSQTSEGQDTDAVTQQPAQATGATPVAPWGSSTDTTGSTSLPARARAPQASRQAPSRRGGRWLWTLFYMAIIAFFILRNTELGLQIERFIFGILWDLGVM